MWKFLEGGVAEGVVEEAAGVVDAVVVPVTTEVEVVAIEEGVAVVEVTEAAEVGLEAPVGVALVEVAAADLVVGVAAEITAEAAGTTEMVAGDRTTGAA